MSETARKQVNLSDSLHRQLNSYAIAATAAGVGALALAQPTNLEAKIVYTHTHVVVGPKGGQYALTLNHNGRTEFYLVNSHSGNIRSSVFMGAATFSGPPGPNRMLGVGQKALALSAGVRVGPKGDWLRYGAGMATNFYTGNGRIGYSGYWDNDGKGVKNRYLGLKFAFGQGGAIHYGWARLNVAIDRLAITTTLTGYAYETIPNKPIIAGKTKGPDVITLEPCGLGRLAQGSAGRLGK